MLYLDANAHVPLLPEVRKFISNYEDLGHPSSIHVLGRKAAKEIEEARSHIAEMIGAKSGNQIFFTSGCTQAAEWGIKILKEKYEGEIFGISPLEHIAVRDAAEQYFGNQLIIGKLIKNQFDYQCIFNTKINKVIYIDTHNETGILQSFPITNQICLSDMSQSLGKIPVNFSKENSDIDIAIFGAHKFGGPTSVGILYLKDSSKWIPFGTGGRYVMDRSGTPDLIGIKSTEIALKIALQTLPKRQENMKKFQLILEEGLKKRGCRIIGENFARLPNTTFFCYPQFAVDKMLKMSEKGIHFGLGSACGSIATGISPSLKALGESGDIYDYARISQWGDYGEKEAQDFLHIWDEVK